MAADRHPNPVRSTYESLEPEGPRYRPGARPYRQSPPEEAFEGGWEGEGWRSDSGRRDMEWRQTPSHGLAPTYGRTGWEYGGAYGEEYARERDHGRRGRWEHEALTAGEIMTRNVKAAAQDASLQTVARIMKEENCGIAPVVDQDQRLLGVVTDRDMIIRTMPEGKVLSELKIADIMTEDVEAVTPDEELRDVIELMGRKQVRRMPVVDSNDRLVGIISMADIANRADYDEDLQEALEKISARRSFWSRLWK